MKAYKPPAKNDPLEVVVKKSRKRKRKQNAETCQKAKKKKQNWKNNQNK